MPKLPEKHILITNISQVLINGVRTFTNALLISETEGVFDANARRYQVRGFGTDPSWTVFDINVPSINYTLTDARSNVVLVSDNHPEGLPICQGAILQIEGGPRLDLMVQDYKMPFRVEPTQEDILKVWEVLPRLVRKSWGFGNMPTLRWVYP